MILVGCIAIDIQIIIDLPFVLFYKSLAPQVSNFKQKTSSRSAWGDRNQTNYLPKLNQSILKKNDPLNIYLLSIYDWLIFKLSLTDIGY